MRATYIFELGDVRVVDAPDASIVKPTDALAPVAAQYTVDAQEFSSLDLSTQSPRQFVATAKAPTTR